METPERNSTCLFSWVTLARASSKCIKHSVLSQAAAKYNGVAPFLEAKFTSARSLPDSQAIFADVWAVGKSPGGVKNNHAGKKQKLSSLLKSRRILHIPLKTYQGTISASKSVQQIELRVVRAHGFNCLQRCFVTSKVHSTSAVRSPHDHWLLQDVLVECLVDWLSHDPLRSTSLSPRLSSNPGWFWSKKVMHEILPIKNHALLAAPMENPSKCCQSWNFYGTIIIHYYHALLRLITGKSFKMTPVVKQLDVPNKGPGPRSVRKNGGIISILYMWSRG